MALRDWLRKLTPSYAPPAPPPAPALRLPTPAAPLPVPDVTIPSPRPPAASTTRPAPRRGEMQVSDVGVNLIKEFERFLPTAYPDQAGIWTIGYGTIRVNGQPVVRGMTCSHDEALAWMHEDLNEFVRKVNEINLQAPTSLQQHQFDACVCFAYNIGSAGFAGSTVARKIVSGRIREITEENFTAWSKVAVPNTNPRQLVVSNGLFRRRKSEYHLFTTGRIRTTF